MRTNGILRLGMCLVMVAASAAAFAGDDASTRPTEPQRPSTTAAASAERTPGSYDTDIGAGSAEPRRGNGEDERAKELAAVQEYNQRKFLDQTWSSP